MNIASALPKKLRQAYTLVELLVVMAALTILAAVLLPSIKSLMHDQKVASASRMVKAHFEAAQARAIGGSSPVAVILERASAEYPNMVTRLSIGQVFPPYEGDTTATTGTLLKTTGSDYYNELAVVLGEASLLSSAAGVFTTGDFLQVDDRQNIYQVLSFEDRTISGLAYRVIKFANPPFATAANGTLHELKEGDLLVDSRTTAARFRLYRKPTKSFLQTLTLPRGTCVDLTVSGLGPGGNEFALASLPTAGLAMVVFNPQGRIAYWNNGADGPQAATSLMHVLIGRTEQVATLLDPDDPQNDLMKVADPDDPSSFNSNINDTNNTWLTVNPFTGAISSSGVQAGNEVGNNLAAFLTRLQTARAFATYGITQSEN